MRATIFCYTTCNRCHKESKFLDTSYYHNTAQFNTSDCKYCRIIPDINLTYFIENHYVRVCPTCNQNIMYKSRAVYRQAVTRNMGCKACANRQTNLKRQHEREIEWKPIIGKWPVTYNRFVAIRKSWNTLSTKEQTRILNLTDVQKQTYWGHLRARNKKEGHRKCRELFAKKYSGENHWMKRPGVLQKIKNSCKKYRGDGHWFRRHKKS